MTEYDTYFKRFYTEKLSFLSMKSTFMKCKGCDEYKKFIEKDNELQFSCGDKQGTCGTQFTIQLPQYINYNQRKQVLQEEIHGSIQDYNPDINDLSYHNQNTIQTISSQKLQPTHALRDIDKEPYQKQLKELNTKYNSQNKSKDLYKHGLDYHKERMLQLTQQKKLLMNMKQESLSTTEKQDIIIQYLSLGKKYNEAYKELYETIHAPFNPYLEEEKAHIQKSNTIISNEPKKASKKKKEDKKYIKGDKVSFETKKGVHQGIINKINANKVTIIEDKTNKKFMIPSSKIIKN